VVALLCAAALVTTGCSEDNPCAVPEACRVLSCVPGADPEPVGDGCGVFVSSSRGDDSAGKGTKILPFKTVEAAISVAKTKHIYLCAEPFVEAVTLTTGFRLYGGLNCEGQWQKLPDAMTIITAAAGEIPITIAGNRVQNEEATETPDGGEIAPSAQDKVQLSDLHVIAKDAPAAGGSSIAALAYDATAQLIRCRIEAGNGEDGQPGAAPMMAVSAGAPGTPGKEACSAEQVLGGDEASNMCSGEMSAGGTGGPGSTSNGGMGASGLPSLGVNGGAGAGDVDTACTAGGSGMPGAAGQPGAGGLGQGRIGRAVVNGKPGYSGAPGKEGGPGSTGQGGGGGGGAKGGTDAGKCTLMRSDGGASGGGGGAGGCGGAGGKAGQPGGSSIALMSINTTLVFEKSTLVAKGGGKGGDGSAGQKGGAGGVGGLGGQVPAGAANLSKGCDGGSGGSGGDGGRGGGGQGGHSLGMAFLGESPPGIGLTIQVGKPGVGGAGDGPEGPGAPGKSPKTLSFGK
jgi:hypothetical protein